jgi:hypothetical protein
VARKEPVWAPCGIVIEPGTVATAVFALLKVTWLPPEGAGALRVTVPVENCPPVTLVGMSTRPLTGTLAVGVALASLELGLSPYAFTAETT